MRSHLRKLGGERHEFGKQKRTELEAPPGRGSPSQLGKCQKESSENPQQWPHERTSEMHAGFEDAASERQFFRGERESCPCEMPRRWGKSVGKFRVSRPDSPGEHTPRPCAPRGSVLSENKGKSESHKPPQLDRHVHKMQIEFFT